MSTRSTIAEYMVEHPYTVRIDDSLEAAAQIMGMHKIRHLPVLNGKKVVGLISERDIAVARGASGGQAAAHKLFVRDVCSFEPYTVNEGEAVSVVARTMAKMRQDAAIVVQNEIPVGIFTTSDACRLLADTFRPATSKQGFWAKLFG